MNKHVEVLLSVTYVLKASPIFSRRFQIRKVPEYYSFFSTCKTTEKTTECSGHQNLNFLEALINFRTRTTGYERKNNISEGNFNIGSNFFLVIALLLKPIISERHMPKMFALMNFSGSQCTDESYY